MNAADPEMPFRQTGWPGLRAKLFHALFLVRRPMTLGVRALIYDRHNDSVFLIRHTYVPGWQLPGGGVEVGETAEHFLGIAGHVVVAHELDRLATADHLDEGVAGQPARRRERRARLAGPRAARSWASRTGRRRHSTHRNRRRR